MCVWDCKIQRENLASPEETARVRIRLDDSPTIGGYSNCLAQPGF